MTEPQHVVNWWGPRGFTTTIQEMDVRPGGVWKHIMHGPDGANYPNHSVFREVVAPERLVFATKIANPFHLARYTLADLFLDTTPYGAHTTASDALWMGVPMLTLSGRSFASRVCGSLVRAAGLPELICESAEDFVNRAVEFGNNPTLLQPHREKLQAGRSHCVLFDMPLLVQRLEELYRQMWDQFQKGELPQPDLVNLDAYLEVGCQPNHEELEVQTLKDYEGWWRENLARRHQFRPIPPDHRLCQPTPGCPT